MGEWLDAPARAQLRTLVTAGWCRWERISPWLSTRLICLVLIGRNTRGIMRAHWKQQESSNCKPRPRASETVQAASEASKAARSVGTVRPNLFGYYVTVIFSFLRNGPLGDDGRQAGPLGVAETSVHTRAEFPPAYPAPMH